MYKRPSKAWRRNSAAIAKIAVITAILIGSQGLYQIMQQKDAQITALQQQVNYLSSQVQDLAVLKARLDALEQHNGTVRTAAW